MVVFGGFQEQTLQKMVAHDRDIQAVDWAGEWDNTLTDGENYNILKGKFPEMFKKETISKNEAAAIQQQMNEIQENYNRHQLESEIEKIKNTPQSVFLESRFKVLNSLIKSLINNNEINSLIVEGDSGIGKSFMTVRTLAQAEAKFETLQGHITPLEFYNFLYKNNGKTIIIDDNGTLLKSDSSLSILLNALWGINNKRIINWFSSSDRVSAPSSFEFFGKLIFLTNKFPETLENIKSRVFFYRFQLSFSDKIKMIYEIAKIKKIDMEICKWIEENCTEANMIDLRTLSKLDTLKKTIGEGWKETAVQILEIDENKALVRDLLQTLNPEQAQAEFVKKTGLSRRTFYNIKKKLR